MHFLKCQGSFLYLWPASGALGRVIFCSRPRVSGTFPADMASFSPCACRGGDTSPCVSWGYVTRNTGAPSCGHLTPSNPETLRTKAIVPAIPVLSLNTIEGEATMATAVTRPLQLPQPECQPRLLPREVLAETIEHWACLGRDVFLNFHHEFLVGGSHLSLLWLFFENVFKVWVLSRSILAAVGTGAEVSPLQGWRVSH